MTASSPPPSEIPHHKKTNTGLIILGAFLLLGTGAAVLFKLSKGEEEPVVEVRVTQEKKAEPAPGLADAPPPPPSDEELAAAEDSAPKATDSAPKSAGATGCSSPCNGTATGELQSALRARGGQARGCYNRALRTNAGLEGKMSISMRVSSHGGVCSVSAANDTLGDSAVSTCVVEMFRSGKYPAPQGGCVDTAVPLNFISKQ